MAKAATNPLTGKTWAVNDVYFLHVAEDKKEYIVPAGKAGRRVIAVKIYSVTSNSVLELVKFFRDPFSSPPGRGWLWDMECRKFGRIRTRQLLVLDEDKPELEIEARAAK